MVAQGATTTASGKSKKSTTSTKRNLDTLNSLQARHFKRYKEWYINMTIKMAA